MRFICIIKDTKQRLCIIQSPWQLSRSSEGLAHLSSLPCPRQCCWRDSAADGTVLPPWILCFLEAPCHNDHRVVLRLPAPFPFSFAILFSLAVFTQNLLSQQEFGVKKPWVGSLHLPSVDLDSMLVWFLSGRVGFCFSFLQKLPREVTVSSTDQWIGVLRTLPFPSATS